MKNYTRLILLLLLTIAIVYSTKAQPSCDESCLEQRHQYLGCSVINGVATLTVKCISNPYGTPGFYVLRPKLPPCFIYDHSTLAPAFRDKRIIFQDGNGNAQTVFNGTEGSIGNFIDFAYSRWYNVCNDPPVFFASGYNNDCCIKFFWSNKTEDNRINPPDPDTTLSLAKTRIILNDSSSCNSGVNCDSSYIILNQTDRFTRANFDPQGRPERFWFSGEGNKVPQADQSKYDYYNLYNTIIHELGHWIGFGHPKATDRNGNIIRNCSDYDEDTGVMNVGEQPHSDDEELSEDDKCMFKKLYCCNLTSVEDDNELFKTTFEVFPNPAVASAIQIRLPEKFAMENKTISLVDIRGKLVLEKRIFGGSDIQTINISRLIAGEYMVIVSFEKKKGSISQKLIIQR